MTHFCLVSDQPIPNLLPLLQPETRPDRVVMAVSERMREKAAWLKREIEKRNIAVEELPLPDAYDIPGLQECFMNWLAAHEDADVALNITGGTKPMAIAAQETFRAAGRPVFYVNIETDELSWLGRDREQVRLTHQATLKTFLGVHGLTVESGQSRSGLSPEWQTFCQELAFVKALPWEYALGKLNYHAMDAERRDVLDMGRVLAEGCPYWDDLMESLYYNEIICDRTRLHFRSVDARRFANGGWLEHLVFDTVKSLEGVHEAVLNAYVRDAHGNTNEFDGVLLSRNRLFIIECKTKKFDKAEGDTGPAAEAIYKLEALRKSGGLRTRGMLVSFRPVADAHKRRAQDAGITVIDQNCLPRLKECLQNTLK